MKSIIHEKRKMKAIVKGLAGILLALFFMGYGGFSLIEGEWTAGLMQIGFGLLIFFGGILMVKRPR